MKIIVERLNISKNPWDKLKGFEQINGVEATMSLDDFEYFWRGSRYHWAQVKL